jgi:hypothetical protein
MSEQSSAVAVMRGGPWFQRVLGRDRRGHIVTRLGRWELVILFVLVVWGLAPLIVMIVHSLEAHVELTGADGLIGADQLQYLAWVRDAGEHGLAANLFELAPSGHVFAQPMFTLSGLLWWLGLPIQLAYLIWKPIAVLVLFGGAWVWAARFFPAQGVARAVAMFLSLFAYPPLGSVVLWTPVGSAVWRAHVAILSNEVFASQALWAIYRRRSRPA